MSSTERKSPVAGLRSLAGTALRSASRLRRSAVNWSDAAQWHLFATRPGLNWATSQAHVERLFGGSVPDAGETGGRLHARVAFHYVPWRLKYLVEVVTALQALPFEHIEICIDTNSEQLQRVASRLPEPFQIVVWDRLDDPFKLTWVHRAEMQKRLGDFDAFLYLEDDIIIPQYTMRRWMQETRRLAAHGFLPGFVRVEESRSGELMLADYLAPLERSAILRLEGRPYLRTPYPYQACWVYDAAGMRELASQPDFLTGDVSNGDLRARIALGLQFTAVPEGAPSRALIPLTDTLQVAPDALVFHAPSNYAQLPRPHPAGLGCVPVSDILQR